MSLLFSSDEETSRQLVQALKELELEVEPCPDVFTAVEWLANRSFDAVVADCDSGPEAAFLLKNAHELKLNKAAFTLAVTSGPANSAGQEIDADLVLAKPLTPDQIKYALLANDRFLSCMKSWIARGDLPQTPQTTPAALIEPQPARLEQPSPVPRIERPDPPSPLLRAERPDELSPRPAAKTAARNPPARVRLDPVKAPPKRSWFLGTIALSVALLVVGYIVAQPLRVQHAFASLSAAYRHTVEGANKEAPPEDAPGSTPAAPTQIADSEAPEPMGNNSARVHVLPAHPVLVPRPTPPVEMPTEAHLNHEDHLPASAPPFGIPESLRTPVPEAATAQTGNAKRTVSLIGQMEPVTLSEESAHELLLQQVEPSYPEQALKAGVQGAVILQAWIDTDGTIRDLKLVGGPLLLGQAAVQAVKQWRYKPYIRNGVAVEAETVVTVNFKLP